MKALRYIYQLQVNLEHMEPPIWRSLLVPSSIELADLHTALQIAMGWKNCHLHQFVVGKVCYGVPDPEFPDDTINESGIRIGSLLKSVNDELSYEYDFGDAWKHGIVLQAISPYSLELKLPQCLRGERACPPENSGGPPGYADFLSAWGDPRHPDHKDMRRWVGKRFTPDKFDVEAVNKKLAKLKL